MPYDIIIGRDPADKEKFGDKGLIYLGKGYVKMGNYTSLSNKIWMDVARSHVILVAGKRGCIEGNTLVFTDKGYKKIKDYEEKEDKVLSFNKETKRFEWENAGLLRYPIENEDLLKIELEDGREIILTKEHPLLTTTGREILQLMWKEAIEFKNGDELIIIDKKINGIDTKAIKEITEFKGVKEIYDLTVPKNHSFIANGIISHNSGKSYSIGVIAEELSNLPQETAKNIAPLIFDTMGIFWTMKYENEKDSSLLKNWDLKTKNLPVKVFIPFGKISEYREKNIPFDASFALEASELEAEDWLSLFNLEIISPVGVLIERTIFQLKENSPRFNISEIKKEIESDPKANKETKEIAYALFTAAENWGIFAKDQGTKISDLVNPGATTVLDISVYSSISSFNVRALVIGLISRKLFESRLGARKKEELEAIRHGQEYLSYKTSRDQPLIWLFLDEAHEFLQREGKTPATDALVQILREGRQPGISLVLATQQPGQIHKDVMTQSDVVIAHKVTAKVDLEALNEIMQSYVPESIKKQMDSLPPLKGSAIILDDNSERIYPVRIRPRFTWHGGEAPSAVKAEIQI